MDRTYLCIDLKSFYASVECVERKLNPMTTDLVVADESRGKGSICLAVSPSLKKKGVKNRCRLFEIPHNIKYIIAKPRMKKYIEYSANIYEIYLKYVAKEDIHVYSIDEAFIDVTQYLGIYKMDGIALAKVILKDICNTYGLYATAGIGTNLYLAKIAMDIIAKHSPEFIGYLDEKLYKEKLWNYRPLSDFWQIGRNIQRRLAKYNIYDMEAIAKCNEKILYKEFGVNAEFLIDHSKGIEPCTIADIKAYKPQNNSVSNSQILFEDYDFEKARIVLKEMVENKCMEMIEKNIVADTISLHIGYSKDVIKASGGMYKLPKATNTYSEMIKYFLYVMDKTTNLFTPIRKISIAFCNTRINNYEQMSMFEDIYLIERERKIEKAVGNIKNSIGKNAVIRGMSLEDGATARVRNTLVGGHNGQ